MSSPTYLGERRSFERYGARFPVKFKDTRNDYGTDVFLRDVSAEGARLVTKDRIFLHDSLAVLVELPDGQEPLNLNGEVVWSRPMPDVTTWDVGIKFHKIDFMKLHRILKFTSTPA